MPLSTSILAQNTPILGIKQETSFGVSLDSTGVDDTNYRTLPLTTATRPKFNVARESRLLSGRGYVKNAADSFVQPKGGTVETPFEMWATPKLFAQLLALVGQNHSESGTYVHTITFDDSGMIGAVGGTITNSIPASCQVAYDTGTNGEGIRINGNVVSSLSISGSYGDNAGNLSLSGTFFSGHSNADQGDAKTTSALEQSFSGGSWVSPETTYFSMHNIQTKTLTAEGTSAPILMKDFSLEIANGANRIGSNSNGDAEAIAIPEYTITGSLGVKYDPNFDYSTGTNVIADFLSGNTATLQLIWGSGLDIPGEMQLDAQIQYPGDPEQDLSESGIFHKLPFECVVNGATPALKIQIFNGESEASW